MVLKRKKINIGKKHIEAILIGLQKKNLILLKGGKGYVMCGYLDLKVAQKFNDVAIKIIGVSSIEQALKTTIHSCTLPAIKLGIRKGQSVKEALKLIV
jgi:uncharacterized protein YunC (DUF1805 family)